MVLGPASNHRGGSRADPSARQGARNGAGLDRLGPGAGVARRMSLIGPNFPRLSPTNHRISSPATSDYNCIAWASGDTEHWWQPNVFWPIPAPKTAGDIQTLVRAFQSLGFELCADGSLEMGFEKVALYGDPLWYLHA